MKTGALQKFVQAFFSREVRRVMPTDLSSAEMEQLPVDVLEHAIISAKTLSEHYLTAAEAQIRDILNPRSETRVGQEGAIEVFTAGTNKTAARFELKKVWEALGYQAPEGKEGTIEDLSSDARIDLVLDMNVDMARGYGQWRQGQSEEVLDLWPCQELFRAVEPKGGPEARRDWLTRWKNAATIVGDYDALKALSAGRMIARKDSPIWEALSRFKTPYPPFDFNSGMWVRDVDRETGVRFGIIGEFDNIVPMRRPFELKEAA